MSDDLVTAIVMRQRAEKDAIADRIKALEAEAGRLRQALATARADALQEASASLVVWRFHAPLHHRLQQEAILALIDQPIASTEGGE
jgi:hypothetical protein